MKKIIAGFLFCFFASATSVLGCVCVPTEGVKKELQGAAAVFSGKFIGIEYRKGAGSDVITSQPSTGEKKSENEIVVLKFQVENWWKGKSTRQVLVFTDRTRNSDGSETISDCDFPFQVGKRYLVYAFSEENHLKTNLCTRTKLLEKAQEDLKLLGKGHKPKRIR
jgi:hypothetical protein